jgi:hypothetical protein
VNKRVDANFVWICAIVTIMRVLLGFRTWVAAARSVGPTSRAQPAELGTRGLNRYLEILRDGGASPKISKAMDTPSRKPLAK